MLEVENTFSPGRSRRLEAEKQESLILNLYLMITSWGQRSLRAILNFTPGPQGSNLSPRGKVHPSFTPRVNTLYCLVDWRGEQRISPPGDNFTPSGKNSPLGDNFAPGSQSLPSGAKLNLGFWLCDQALS
jgi:hypothetical protein